MTDLPSANRTIRGRILTYLRDHTEGVDDDELARALNIKYRQQANKRCRQLAAEGIVERRRIRGKIHPPNVYRLPQRLETAGHRGTENTEPLIPLCAPCLCGKQERTDD